MKLSTVYCLLSTILLSGCLEMQAPAPVTRYNPGEGAASAGIHTVTQGETLWVISKRYNIAARDIAFENNLSPPFYLSGGQRLKLPPPQEYTVRPGDRMDTVSRLFGVGASEIARMNDLQAPYALNAGQVLRLPSVTQKNEPEAFAVAQAAPLESVQIETLAPPSGAQVEPLSPPPQTMQAQAVDRSPVLTKTPKRSSNKFLRPVGGKIISGYGAKDNGLYNDGINIAAPRGAPVRAAENGVVVYAGNELKGSGNLVLIRHEGRWVTAYAHMDKILIKRGTVIKRGQTIGTVGTTGGVNTPQLHFEARRGTEALNPMMYVEG